MLKLRKIEKDIFLNKTYTSINKGLKGIPAYYYHSVTTELEAVAEKMISISTDKGKQVQSKKYTRKIERRSNVVRFVVVVECELCKVPLCTTIKKSVSTKDTAYFSLLICFRMILWYGMTPQKMQQNQLFSFVWAYIYCL